MPDKAEDGTARVGAKEGVKLGRWLGRGVLRYGIEKELDGQIRTHQMIRADTYQSADAATEASLFKAKQLIDQQGEAIFG